MTRRKSAFITEHRLNSDMKKLFNILILLILALSCYSCQETGLEENYNIIIHDTDIKPLKVGNEWNYEIIYYDSTESFFASELLTYEITTKQLRNGEEWYTEEHTGENLNTSLDITNRDNGLWGWNSSSDFNPNQPYRIVSYPVSIKEEFVVSIYENTTDDTLKIIRQVTDIGKKVKVKAGNFRCIEYTDRRISSDGDTLDPFIKVYYSPQVGLIKTLRYYKLKSGREILSQEQNLTSYKIK